MKKVVIIGQAHPIRGGIASFNERLATEFQQQGFDTTIYTFSYQYPAFMFPGKTQYSKEPLTKKLNIKVCINSINPFNWIKIGYELKNLRPDIIVVAYWLPLMGPALGAILRLAKKNKHTKIICIAHNAIPHEKRVGDKQFTQYFIKPVDAFISLSEKVTSDLRTFTQKPLLQTVHPLFDHFGDQINKAEARQHLGLNMHDNIILFFGFIRKYKGLDLLLEAMKILTKHPIPNPQFQIPKLLIAGEFYEDEQPYQQLIDKLGIRSHLIIKADFIPENEVKYYLSAADFVIQPYRNATQSGVTPLAYHFEKPMLVTNVGGLPHLVPNGKAGLVCEPNPADIAAHIRMLYELGEDYFLPHLREEKKKYSWGILVDCIKELSKQINR